MITLAIHQDPETARGGAGDACAGSRTPAAESSASTASAASDDAAAVAKIRERVSGHVAALPVPYRTTDEQPSFQSLRDPHCHVIPGDRPFPTALDPFVCNRYELEDFARRAQEIGVAYFGVCCGAGPHHIRAVAEGLGRTPPASRFSPDMSKHAFLGTHERVPQEYKEYAEKL